MKTGFIVEGGDRGHGEQAFCVCKSRGIAENEAMKALDRLDSYFGRSGEPFSRREYKEGDLLISRGGKVISISEILFVGYEDDESPPPSTP